MSHKRIKCMKIMKMFHSGPIKKLIKLIEQEVIEIILTNNSHNIKKIVKLLNRHQLQIFTFMAMLMKNNLITIKFNQALFNLYQMTFLIFKLTLLLVLDLFHKWKKLLDQEIYKDGLIPEASTKISTTTTNLDRINMFSVMKTII